LLKKDQFNFTLMAYLRTSKMKKLLDEEKTGEGKPLKPNPFDLKFEVECVKVYKDIIEAAREYHERFTTLQVDKLELKRLIKQKFKIQYG